jgi:hypothetical protein
LHLLLDEHRGGEFHSLPAFFNACAQKQRAQVLFHRPRADIQMARDFFVAASLHEQTQYLLVTGSDLNFIKVNHGLFVGSFSSSLGVATRQNRSKLFAKSSPIDNAI